MLWHIAAAGASCFQRLSSLDVDAWIKQRLSNLELLQMETRNSLEAATGELGHRRPQRQLAHGQALETHQPGSASGTAAPQLAEKSGNRRSPQSRALVNSILSLNLRPTSCVHLVFCRLGGGADAGGSTSDARRCEAFCSAAASGAAFCCAASCCWWPVASSFSCTFLLGAYIPHLDQKAYSNQICRMVSQA